MDPLTILLLGAAMALHLRNHPWRKPEVCATARAFLPRNASLCAKVKVFIFRASGLALLRRLTRHGRQQLRSEPGDVPLRLPDADAEARGQLLVGADGPALLRRPEAGEVYARRPDAFGEFLCAYEEYLDGKRDYSEISSWNRYPRPMIVPMPKNLLHDD
jgi:hypothetical protein